MTSLTIKGAFPVVADSNDQIRIGVNHLGVPAHLALTPINAVITARHPTTGVVAALDNASVTLSQLDVITANDSLYERRRIAWVKMTFIPKYTSFVQNIGDGSGGQQIAAQKNEIVYVVSDMAGLNSKAVDVSSSMVARLLANNTGIKLKSLGKRFKVFRRSRKYPFAPRYMPANGEQGIDPSAHLFMAGAWRNSSDYNHVINGDHTWICTESLASLTGNIELFECVFEIKYVWADRRTQQ